MVGGDNSTTIKNKYDNYEDLLNEINNFVSCPKLIEPLIDNDDSFCDLEDNELAEKLDSQLLNVLVSSSSLCDTESLISEFNLSDDDDDDLDRIVEQLQTTTTTANDETKVSMPTLQSLFTVKNTSLLPSTNEQNKLTKLNDDQINKLKRKKIKFMQHQSKVNYSFSNESSVRLFDKLINCKSKFNVNSENVVDNQNQELKSNQLKNRRQKQFNQSIDIQLIDQQTNRSKNHQYQNKLIDHNHLIDPLMIENNVINCLSSKNKNTHYNKLINLDNQQNKSSLSKDLDREVKRKIENNRSMNKKPKSEIFTLKSNKNTSSLDNLLASIRSK